MELEEVQGEDGVIGGIEIPPVALQKLEQGRERQQARDEQAQVGPQATIERERQGRERPIGAQTSQKVGGLSRTIGDTSPQPRQSK